MQQLAERICSEALNQGFMPDPVISVSEWADRHRILPRKASAEPGHWRTARTPYLREILDCLSPHNPTEKIVFVKGSQLGATECGLNWIGYVIHCTPSPMLMVQPTIEMAKRISKQRLASMIAETKVLRELVAESRSRDSGNTLFAKEFKGGILVLTGANSATGLRSMPVRFLFLDEIDGYPQDVEEEGDPISLAEKRTATFARRKIFAVSTPTIQGFSNIEREFLRSDQRRYFVPCPHCGNMDWIRWDNIQFEEHKPDTAKLFCEGCKKLVEEKHKTWMLEHGAWQATVQGNKKIVGFHLSSLYSPLGWKSWADIVAEFLAAKQDRSKLKVWINTILGELWKEEGDEVEADSLKARLEEYPAEVPNGVGMLVASVDVQANRLECQVVGYGAGEESWLIAFTQFHGDPGREQVWNELDQFLLQDFEHESGQKMKIASVGIDSGMHTEQVYRFCKVRMGRKVWALKGVVGKEVVGRPSDKNRYHTKLFTVGTDTAKDIIFSRLKIKGAGPGCMHFPKWIDDEYLAQLTAEKAIRKYIKGRGAIREYIKIRERNEALDLTVYSLATLYTLGQQTLRSLGEKAQEQINAKANEKKGEDKQEQLTGRQYLAKRLTPANSSWVNSWR